MLLEGVEDVQKNVATRASVYDGHLCGILEQVCGVGT
jgi:hypothetical protein